MLLMLKKWRREDIHNFIHLLGLSLIVIGMPFSKVLMSLGTLIGLINVITEANFKEYWGNLKSNKVFCWIVIYFALHFIGLIWTTNYQYAFHDIQIKVTLIVIPLVLISKPLKEKEFNYILHLFVATMFVSSLVNFLFYNHWIGNKSYMDIRDMSLFASHIRYAILIVLAIIVAFTLQKKSTNKFKFIGIIFIGWFVIYTIYSQVLTGFLALFTALLVYSIIKTYKYNKILFFGVITLFLSLLISLFIFLSPKPIKKIQFKQLPKYTKEGNAYKNDFTLKGLSENQPIFVSICDKEIKREWNKLSTIDYYGRDKLNQRIRTTIIRFLTSKNLSKDAFGITQLNKQEILAIENGIANVNETRFGIIARMYGLRYQLQNSKDPNGHSILQRLHYWKNAKEIIKQNPIIGVGTGDLQIAFNKQYSITKSPLIAKNRLRAHNTYLTSWIAFGIFGLISFIGILYQFIKDQYKQKSILGILFGAIMATTFLIEDTLETQLGVTIFAFFIGIFLQRLGSDKSGLPIKE